MKLNAKVLIVDDEIEVCQILQGFLTRQGYEASFANSGEEALLLIKKDKPHIVLLDIRMPGMDGIRCLEKIKELDKNIGVIMITCVKDEKVGQLAMDLGAFDYITKPLSFDYLKNCLVTKIAYMRAETQPST